jgi:hypothetical protein
MKKLKYYEAFLGAEQEKLIPEPLERDINKILFKIPVKVRKEVDENIFSYGYDVDDIVRKLEDEGFDASWLRWDYNSWKDSKLYEFGDEDEPDREDFEDEDDYNAEYEDWKEREDARIKFEETAEDELFEEWAMEQFGGWSRFLDEFELDSTIDNVLDKYEQEEIFDILKDDFNEVNLAEYFDEAEELGILDMKVIGHNFEDGKFTVEVTTTEDLNDEQIEKVRDYIEGQCSDGWGEGFEQHEIGEGRWYVSTWWSSREQGLPDYEIEIVK